MCTGAILLYGIPRVVIGENRSTGTSGEAYKLKIPALPVTGTLQGD
jgi:tRNA(Arg) A34 adenosine deaminase TadA